MRIIPFLKNMQEKLQYLLDRNQEFSVGQAQILDDLTLSLRNNTSNVNFIIFRAKRQIKFGEF